MKVVMKFTATALVCALALCGQLLNAQQKGSSSSVPVHLVITDVGLKADAELPRLRQDEVKVKQGKTFLQITAMAGAPGWQPA
jgi:hypothetical protein